MHEKVLVQLKEIAETAAKDNSAPIGSPARMIGDYYKSGMDEAAIEQLGMDAIAEELAMIDAIQNREELLKVIAHHHMSGFDSLFNLSVDQDAKRSVQYIIDLSQAGLGLPDRDYYLKQNKKSREIRNTYIAHIAKMFELMGKSTIESSEAAQIVMNLETKLARTSITNVALRDPQQVYHLMQLSDLERIAPGIDWKIYFSAINVSYPKDINVEQPLFFRTVGVLLKSESIERWKTYLRWHLIASTASYLSKPICNREFSI